MTTDFKPRPLGFITSYLMAIPIRLSQTNCYGQNNIKLVVTPHSPSPSSYSFRLSLRRPRRRRRLRFYLEPPLYCSDTLPTNLGRLEIEAISLRAAQAHNEHSKLLDMRARSKPLVLCAV